MDIQKIKEQFYSVLKAQGYTCGTFCEINNFNYQRFMNLMDGVRNIGADEYIPAIKKFINKNRNKKFRRLKRIQK